MLLTGLRDPDGREAVRVGENALSYEALAAAAGAVAARVEGASRVAVVAQTRLETVVAVVGALAAGVPIVPINPKAGERELEHILSDSQPDLMLDDVDLSAAGPWPKDEPEDEAPAIIVYTSGTTGPPKGVVLPRRALAANLDALYDAWAWTADDVVAHGLPLFHVHGLILGTLGPLRLGGGAWHLGKFSTAAAAEALRGRATMLFGVPTMYHRAAADLEADPELAAAFGAARLLVSGSAALPAADHERIRAACGQELVERYGMSETLMNTAIRADGERRPGTVGVPLSGVSVRLVDDSGAELDVWDDETVGEIQVRGSNLFLEYLNRPDATAEAFRDGWFATGDVATRSADGYIRIVGRRATDLIKSGGYKIGAGEIENALNEHPAVAESAVTGEPDADLGERIVAWVVVEEGASRPSAEELADHVARLLTPHKRPRDVRYLDALPRNAMGKVTKATLGS
ncbi:acyl-CoA synthetase [Solirubrobacter sp. CPCC 204708]|uniref:Acyl-CoA synthetase n=1 Tax=Solirubrobacter deserti TaxID=2282478 RepID=A0ABT4RD21_9ACTN|nr:acyl-CoA synthetase [Solirubrobacter deserti]MBE2317783.1 acyl-CoA synthetase [Solirubrobacter deserti]MDA0136440.1 acyl-CoA synthetase [Solirubrobacter deserti]